MPIVSNLKLSEKLILPDPDKLYFGTDYLSINWCERRVPYKDIKHWLLFNNKINPREESTDFHTVTITQEQKEEFLADYKLYLELRDDYQI